MPDVAIAVVALAAGAVLGVWIVRRRPAPPGPGLDPAPASPPPDLPPPTAVYEAWVQFLRDDVANGANALNNRLQVIQATVEVLAGDAEIAARFGDPAAG